MNSIRSLEASLAKLYAGVPNLPPRARRWIAVNSWWITLVLAIISALGLLVLIPVLIAAAAIVSGASLAGIYPYASVSPMQALVGALVSLVALVLDTILLFAAVSPLKALRHRGWTLLFVSALANVVLAVINFIVTIQQVNIFSLISSLVFVAIQLYFLFQIRPEFVGRVAKAREAEVVDVKE